MKKFCAIACTIGFSAFWVFGGLAILSFVQGDQISAVVLSVCAVGLAVGIYTRRKLVSLQKDVQRGRRVVQAEV